MMRPRSPFWPLLLWIVPQLTVLVLMAAQVPIAASRSLPQPIELMSLRLMLFVQIAFAALVFPYLLRDFRAAFLVLCAAIPMTLLASFLTGENTRWKMAHAIGYVLIWLLTLALWRPALRGPRSRAVGVAVALLIVFGGVIFWYLRAEFTLISDALDLRQAQAQSPIFGAFAASADESLNRHGWLFIGALLASGFLAVTSSHLLDRWRAGASSRRSAPIR